MMKKLTSTLALVLGLALCACSSDGDDSKEQLSEAQLNAIVGTWNLVEYNVTPPQDGNNDGTASGNLLEELDCLSGSLVLTNEFKWTRTLVQLGSAPITGGELGLFCASTSTKSGSWAYLEGDIYLSEGTDGIYSLNGTSLTFDIGETLPGIDSYVYEKQ